LGDVERMAFEEAERHAREIEAISRAYQEMARVAPELEGLPEVLPSPMPPTPAMEEPRERLFSIAEAMRALKELELREVREGIDLTAEKNRIEREILLSKIAEKTWALQRAKNSEEAVQVLEEMIEAEKRLRELEKPLTKETTVMRDIRTATERLAERLLSVVVGRERMSAVMGDFLREVQESIAKELLKPLTDALQKAMGKLATQLSSAIGSVLAKLPQSIQLGLGGLALFGGLRPVTEAIEGVGKFITHTVGEVLKVFGIRIGGKKKASPPAVIPLGAAVYGPSINLSTAVTLQVDGRELGRVLVRQAV